MKLIEKYKYKLSPKAKVLLVEDDPTMLATQELVLKQQGFKVFPTDEAEKAKEIMERHNIDLVITDIYLKDKKMNGLDLAHSLRKRYPLIIISGADVTDDDIAMIKEYADVFLEKFDAIYKLVNSVEKLLNLKSEDNAIAS